MAKWKVQGMGRLLKKLDLIGKISNAEMGEIISTATEKGYQSTMKKVPVKTGVLRDSIKKELFGKPVRTGRFYTDKWYGVFQEYGTKTGIKPKRFMKRGRGAATRELRKGIKLLAVRINGV